MRFRNLTGAALALGFAMFLAGPSSATIMLKLDLTELTARAGTIVMGTVTSVEEGTIEVGGGEFPTVTYRVMVDQLFKGEATEVKGDKSIVEIRMVGSLVHSKANENGQVKLSAFRDVPKLREGSNYLLFASPASTIGLSTTIGLGQGAFKVYPVDGELMAVNEFNNAGLGLNGAGPVQLEQLSANIRALLGQ